MGRINMDLLDKVMNHIEANEAAWNQSTWSSLHFDRDVLDKIGLVAAKAIVAEDPFNPICGTTGCFAGHAAITFGDWKFDLRGIDEHRLLGNYSLDQVINKKDGRLSSVENAARHMIRLEPFESDRLFNGSNDLATLRNMVEFMREHDELPQDWDDPDRDREVHYCECEHCTIQFEDEA